MTAFENLEALRLVQAVAQLAQDGASACLHVIAEHSQLVRLIWTVRTSGDNSFDFAIDNVRLVGQ